MLERTLVLVDTSYLLASFYNSWEEGARGQLEISLATVVHRLDQVSRGLVDQPVQRQNWYDGIPDSGPHRYQRTLRVIENVQLRAGQLIEWGDRRTQKAVDTLLVADMIQAAYRNQFSDMVLVTGDADMIPGVRVAVDAGVRVHLVGFGWDSISSALRHACDTTTVLDPRTEFEDAMQIRVLEGPIPPRVRPTEARPVSPGDDPQGPEVDEAVGMVGVDLRADRAAATTVADEARLTVADEELAADAEELARDVEECSARTETFGAPADGERQPTGGETAREEHPVDPASGPDRRAGAEAGSRQDPPAPAAPSAPLEPSATPAPATPAPASGAAPGPRAGERSGTDAPGGGEPGAGDPTVPQAPAPAGPAARPNPSMMAQHRRPLRSKYVPLSEEVWTSSGEQTPFDVGRQYAAWWYEQAASDRQRDEAHLLSGGVLPQEVDRPLLQFACQMLNEFTLSEHQRVRLRDGFHEGIRAVLLKHR